MTTPTNDVVSPLRHFVNLQHEHAVDGAVSSDSEDMQVILQDLAGSDAAIDEVTAARHDKPLVKTQYGAVPISITLCTPETSGSISTTYPCDKVALHMDTKNTQSTLIFRALRWSV
jgi:hypothetical protein